MSLINDIPDFNCSNQLKKILRQKGCKLVISGTQIPRSDYKISTVLHWVYINFGYNIWATYDNDLKYWVGNYQKIGDEPKWVAGFCIKEEALEAALEVVVNYLI